LTELHELWLHIVDPPVPRRLLLDVDEWGDCVYGETYLKSPREFGGGFGWRYPTTLQLSPDDDLSRDLPLVKSR